VPSKVTVNYLKSIGFTSSNDSYMVGMLKGIGFVDSGGNPTERWKAYRGSASGKVMAEAIRMGYAGLFSTYPDADKRDDEAIANLIRQNSNFGADTITRVVGSFKALCGLADFSGQPSQVSAVQPAGAPPIVATQQALHGGQPFINPGQPVINLNIQLELPAQADEKFYDAFFEAMKKHLMP
jgi:hypothetical protein